MKPLDSEIINKNGRPTLHLNGTPEAPHVYGLTDCPGARFAWEEIPFYNINRFSSAGIRLYQLMLWEEWLYPDDNSDTLDLTIAKKQINAVLKAKPDGVVFFRYHLNTTQKWNEANPDECVQYADTDYYPPIEGRMHRPVDDDEKATRRPSLASEVWKERSGRRLKRFLEAMADTEEGNALAGIQVACGVFGEWHQWGFLRNEPDESPAMLAFFRDWLSQKYSDAPTLQNAWNDSSVTFETANIPSLTKRQCVDDGIFRDPQKNRQVADYYQALQSAPPRAILHFCKIVKDTWPRKIITSAFHGYFKFLFGRSAIGGHTRVCELLQSEWIDCLCAPQSYNSYCREIGGSGESRGLVDACRRAGKLWLDEMDQNTHLGSILVPSVSKTFDEDVGVMNRNILYPFCHGGGGWYYDFGPFNFAGAWDSNQHIDAVATLQKFQTEQLAEHKAFSRSADVLVIFDDQTFYHQSTRWEIDSVTSTAVDVLPAMLARTGVSFESAYLYELEDLDLSPFQVVIFANTNTIDTKQCALIDQKVKRNNRHLIWFYLSGYNNNESLSLAHTESLTGFKLKLHQPETTPRLSVMAKWIPAQNEPLEFRAPDLKLEGTSIDLTAKTPDAATHWHRIPMPVLNGEQGEVWGWLDPIAIPAATTQGMGDWTSWFAPFPIKTVSTLRAILKKAGAHIFCEHDGTITTGGGILLIHARNSGLREIALKNGQSVSIELKRAQTAAIDMENGTALLS